MLIMVTFVIFFLNNSFHYRHSTSKGFVTADDSIPWWRAVQQDWYLFLQRASEQNQGPGACPCWRWGSDLSPRSCLWFGNKLHFSVVLLRNQFYSTKNMKWYFSTKTICSILVPDLVQWSWSCNSLPNCAWPTSWQPSTRRYSVSLYHILKTTMGALDKCLMHIDCILTWYSFWTPLEIQLLISVFVCRNCEANSSAFGYIQGFWRTRRPALCTLWLSWREKGMSTISG